MIPKVKWSRGTSTMTNAVLWGSLASMLITLMSAMVIAWLMASEKMPEQNMGYAVMGLLLLASFCGGIIACKKQDKQRLTISLITGGAYIGILLAMGALFYDGQLTAVGETMLLVLCGSILAAMWTSRGKRKTNFRKIKISNR